MASNNALELFLVVRRKEQAHKLYAELAARERELRSRSWRNVALTERQREILPLILDGLSNLNIGATLGIAERTAMWHVGLILRKFGVKSRGELKAELSGVESNPGNAVEVPLRVPSSPVDASERET